MIRRTIIFLAVFLALQMSWQAVTDTAIQHVVIDRGVVAPAALIANLLTPEFRVRASGNRLRETSGGINIVNGCDGMETLFLLLAGFAVAPISWRARIGGILVGLPLVYALNQARILALFYAHHSDAELFDLLHGFIAPVILVLVIAAYFYVWLFRTQSRAAASAV